MAILTAAESRRPAADEVDDLRVSGPVEDLSAFVAVDDQPAFLQASDVTGDISLRPADQFDEVLHPLLVIDERQQDCQTSGVRETSKQLRCCGDGNGGLH